MGSREARPVSICNVLPIWLQLNAVNLRRMGLIGSTAMQVRAGQLGRKCPGNVHSPDQPNVFLKRLTLPVSGS